MVTIPRSRPNVQKRALDLFSGSGSVGQRLREWGYEVTSLDNDPAADATFHTDVMKWPYKKLFPPKYFDLIAAGVPCQEYSVAKTVGTRDLASADKLVRKTIEVLEYFRQSAGGLKTLVTVF